MPTAAALAATTVQIPPSGTCFFIATPSSSGNEEYTPIIPDTLKEVPEQQTDDFKSWLASVPFQFDDFQPATLGRYLGSEADVRMFIESSIILPCWPVALAMVIDDKRKYDLTLRSEFTFPGSHSRPDLSILQLKLLGEIVQLQPVTAVEYKGPGMFSTFNMNQLTSVSNDDWDIVTSQLRKYSCTHGVTNIIAADNEWMLFFHFTDATDEFADVEFLISPCGTSPPGFHATLTARELFLFAIYRSLLEKVTNVRNYAAVPVSSVSLAYVEKYPNVNPSRLGNAPASSTTPRPGGSGRRLRSTLGGHTLILNSTHHTEFPKCTVKPTDIGPPTMSGDMSDSGIIVRSRRDARSFFISNSSWLYNLPFGIESQVGRVWLSQSTGPARSSTPPPTADLVLKCFKEENIMSAYREASAYANLKALQGSYIPYCYGIFDVSGAAEIGMLLEKIDGIRLDDFLDSSDEIDMRSTFMTCLIGLRNLHAEGYCHGDISGANILVSKGSMIGFVDLENSRPITNAGKRFDEIHLRMIFRRHGIEEQILKDWARV